MKWSQIGLGLVLLKRDSQKTMQDFSSIHYAQVIFETFRYCPSFIIVILECLLIECFISQKEDLNENSIFTLDALQIHAKSVPVIPMNTRWGDISIMIVLHICHCFKKCGGSIMKYRIPPADQGNLNICVENLL